jgi:hypothetical protein
MYPFCTELNRKVTVDSYWACIRMETTVDDSRAQLVCKADSLTAICETIFFLYIYILKSLSVEMSLYFFFSFS